MRLHEPHRRTFSHLTGGSITGLFGPHGVGETTLMSTIGGHDQVAAKSVCLLGENLFEYARAMASTNLRLPSAPEYSGGGSWSPARSQ